MNSRKRKLIDDKIEAEVLADLADPSAWDEPIYVPPSKSPRLAKEQKELKPIPPLE
jgi:hypothetical protein